MKSLWLYFCCLLFLLVCECILVCVSVYIDYKLVIFPENLFVWVPQVVGWKYFPLEKVCISFAGSIPFGCKYLSNVLGYCLGFHFTFPCLSDRFRVLLQKCQEILVLYNGGIFFSSLGNMSFHKDFYLRHLETGTVKDIILERSNIAFHFLKGVCTWSTDLLIKPTYEMRNPDSKLRGGGALGTLMWEEIAEIKLKCLIKWILNNPFIVKHFDSF